MFPATAASSRRLTPSFDGGGGGRGGGGGGGGGGIPSSDTDFGGLPPEGIPDPNTPSTGASATVTEDLTTALLAASSVILGWLILTIMLIVVPMLRGHAPRIGMNLQVAVWSSLPLAVMAVIQLIYYAAGGNRGAPGIEGVVTALPEFSTWEPTVQALAISLASRFTIFWLWSLMLVCTRYSLQPERLADRSARHRADLGGDSSWRARAHRRDHRARARSRRCLDRSARRRGHAARHGTGYA
ncbi:MAG: hypothetical protein HND48_16645 [Chloroflexi bacterium]|nr:hypothetical protein [Chloroflexota bacterium]